MKIVPLLAALLTAIGWPQAVPAQAQLWSDAAKSVQIVNARKANAALMRQYTWTSRTEVIDQGKVKDTRIELVSYGPTGQLQRSLLNDQSAPLPGGFLRRAIAEDERKKMEGYLKGLEGLLEQYTLPTAGKVLDFISQAQAIGPDASGALEMTGHSVVVPGDTFSVWTDAATRQTRRVQVSTVFQGDAVNVTATFNTLPSRLTYMAYAEATVPSKQLSVQVQNFNYNRGGAASPMMGAPPPAPATAAPAAATSRQAQATQHLKTLKSLLNQGLITQEQYQAESQKILDQLLQ